MTKGKKGSDHWTDPQKVESDNGKGKHKLLALKIEYGRRWGNSGWQEEKLAKKGKVPHESGVGFKLEMYGLGAFCGEKGEVLAGLNFVMM